MRTSGWFMEHMPEIEAMPILRLAVYASLGVALCGVLVIAVLLWMQGGL